MSQTHKDKIEINLNLLCEILELSESLLIELLGMEVMDFRTKEEIFSIRNCYKRNNCFLNWLKDSSPNVFEIWMEKLRQTNQKHIANLLDGNPGELPLSEKVKNQLRRNIGDLSELIDTQSGIVEYLWSRDAISFRDRKCIDSLPNEYDKALELFKQIIRKSDRTYDLFLDGLDETGQSHIAEAVKKGKVTKVHVKLLCTAGDTSTNLIQLENLVIEVLNAIAKNINPSDIGETKDRIRQIFNEELKIIGCKQTQSVIIFIWCKDDEAMDKLLTMFETRQLERDLERICRDIKTSTRMANVIIRVTMTQDDLRCLRLASLLLSSETRSPLTYEELQHEFCELKSCAKEMENKISTLEAQILSEKSNTERLKSENSNLQQGLLSSERKNQRLESCIQKPLAQKKGVALDLDTFSTEDEVFGLAYLNDTIYLLARDWITTYRSQNKMFLKSFEDIEIREIEEPCDIVACYKAKCLYVSDLKQQCIWRIEICDKTQKLFKKVSDMKPFKWLVGIEEPFTFSVSSDGHVLIPKSTPYLCIECYNMRGDLKKTVDLSRAMGLGYPICAVKTTTEKYVVSFCNNDDIVNDSCICEFNENGEMERRPQISDVSHMAAGDGNWVFAARSDFNKIVMSDQVFACDILTYQKDSIQRPSKLSYIKGNGRQDQCLAFLHEEGHTCNVSVWTFPASMSCVLTDWE